MALNAPYPFEGKIVKETLCFPQINPQSSARENSRIFYIYLNLFKSYFIYKIATTLFWP